MSPLLPLIVYTANILGIFTDPFEFEGDYGAELNPIMQHVFELVVSREARVKHLANAHLVRQAAEEDAAYGPTLAELVPIELIEGIKQKQVELEEFGFSQADLNNILSFIEIYKELKVFRFFRHTPPVLLGLDHTLRDQAAREGRAFDLPILGSMRTLEGKNGIELKNKLLDAIFTEELLAQTKPQNALKASISKLDEEYLKEFLGDSASIQDLQLLSSPAGQLFFFWIYQALDLHLISLEPGLIEQVNKVKEVFARTLGDAANRAETLKQKLISSNCALLFTQESDALVPQLLTREGLFHPVDRQNPGDGTFVFLRSDVWESDYQVIPLEEYEKFHTGCINLILATRKGTGQRFLLAACHGHSTKAEDGRLQIALIMQRYHQLYTEGLQLLIGTDANTKSELDVRLFREHLEALGLTATSVGPTTIKRRMVTAQHSKAGRFAMDEEDYLITLKCENGSELPFSEVMVGFKGQSRDLNQPLPNQDNLSDHYPVGAVINDTVSKDMSTS